jgi:hypothetical protein
VTSIMKRNGILPHLALASFLTTGFLVVWALVSLWAVEIGEHVVRPAAAVERLVFLPDGTARVARTEGRHQGLQYRDLDGNPAAAPENEAMLLTGSPLPASLPARPLGDIAWDGRIRSFSDGGTPAVYWYFVADGRPDGTGYFVGYHSRSKACVGYLGLAGWQSELPPVGQRIPFMGAASGDEARIYCTQSPYNPTFHPTQRFSGKSPRGCASNWDVYVLGRDSKFYHADLQNRTLEVALDTPGLRSAALTRGLVDLVHGTPTQLAARTDDAVLVLDERGGVQKRFPIPEALHDREIHFAQATSGEAVMYAHGPEDELAEQVEYWVYWVNAAGVCREANVRLAWAGENQSLRTLGGVEVPAPLAAAGLVAGVRTKLLLGRGLAATYPQALGRAFTEFAPALLIAQLVAAALAWACYRRQVRFGASRGERVIWPLFVLVLGLPGWIGYRYGRSWPVLQACSACATEVPQDRDNCVQCTVEFPRPVLRGTEVFA